MPSVLCPHWIPVHHSSTDTDVFRAWNPPFVKVVSVDARPPYLNELPVGAKIVLRNHPMSEGFGNRSFNDIPDAQAQAARDVAVCREMAGYARETYGIRDPQMLFEGRNEPMVWSTEPPELTAAYYTAFLTGLHAIGLNGVALNLGVGWPGNDGQDRPPMWGPFKPVIDAMGRGDYIGLHEYWAGNGPEENWKWWAGRFTQCPYDVPMLITECGVDFGVVGLGGNGWLSQYMPGDTPTTKAIKYVSDLRRYEELARPDGRAVATFIFTHDGQEQDWWTFDTRHPEFTSHLIAYTNTMTNVPLPPGHTGTVPPVAHPLAELLQAEFGSQFSNLVSSLAHGPTPYALRPVSSITQLVLHHTASPQTTTWQAVANYHVNTKGWPGIGYHIGVDTVGNVALLNYPESNAYQVGAQNGISLGVAVPGNYITDSVTPLILNTLQRVMTVVRQYLGRQVPCIGHDDAEPGATVCPGTNLIAILPALNTQDLSGLRNAAWNALYPSGVAYNPDAAFAKYARENALGVPTTNEFTYGPWQAQGYADAIVYCVRSNWSSLAQLPW